MMSLGYEEKEHKIYIQNLHEVRQPDIANCSSEHSSDGSTVENPVSLLSAIAYFVRLHSGCWVQDYR